MHVPGHVESPGGGGSTDSAIGRVLFNEKREPIGRLSMAEDGRLWISDLDNPSFILGFLPNGGTFFTSLGQGIEIDGQGNVLASRNLPLTSPGGGGGGGGTGIGLAGRRELAQQQFELQQQLFARRNRQHIDGDGRRSRWRRGRLRSH